MLPDKRDPNVTYKFTKVARRHDNEVEYVVACFPGSIEESKDDSPMPSLYRKDFLPKWAVDGINILDVPRRDIAIPFFGEKKGNSYWFYSNDWMKAYEDK